MRKLLGFLLWLWILVHVPVARGDAAISDWPGQYAMNHDGHLGTLLIVDSKRDCAGLPWCHLVLTYRDKNGVESSGRIDRIDQNFQHMLFQVEFPGNLQRFDAYLFSWNKNSIAGTTYWGGRTFGFFATRSDLGIAGKVARQKIPVNGASQAKGTPQAPTEGYRTIGANGAVEIHYPDGSIKLPQRCGFIIIHPDGQRTEAVCKSNVQPATPPPLPQNTAWLDQENGNLLEAIRTLVGNDDGAIQSYLSSEGVGMSLYDRIAKRTETIRLLLAP
jgi:hypothetical protein